MNRIFKTVLPASILAFSAFSKSVFALPNNQFYTGFNAGVGNQSLQYSNYDNLIGTTTFPANTTINYTKPLNSTVSAPVFVGGLLLGYSQSLGKKYNLEYELSAKSNVGSTSVTDQMQSPFTYSTVALQEYTAQTTIKFPYVFDFALKPTIALTKKLAGYFKAGPSYAQMNTTLNFTHNNALLNEVFSVTNGNHHPNAWGYVVGTGLEWAITKKTSFFSEFNFHQYAATDLKNVTVIDNGSANGQAGVTYTHTIYYYRRVLPYLSSFNIGIHYYF